MPRLGKASINRLRAELTRQGTAIARDWANADSVEIRGLNVQPATAKEMETDREYAETVLHVWAPVGTDILATDRAEYPAGSGVFYDVQMDGQKWANIRSRPHHVAFDMIVRSG